MWVADTAANAEVLRLLIEQGAEVNTLDIAVEPTEITDALSWTMLHGDCAMIQVLLDNGVKINQQDALTCASYKGFTPAVRLLLAYGADPAALDCYEKSALAIARDGGHQEIVQLLLTAERNRHPEKS